MLLWFAFGSIFGVWNVFQSPGLDFRLIAVGALLPLALDAPFGAQSYAHTLCSAVVVFVKGTLLVGELAAKLLKWMRHSEANKVVIQTPFQTLELHKDSGVTEEDVRKLLKAAMELH